MTLIKTDGSRTNPRQPIDLTVWRRSKHLRSLFQARHDALRQMAPTPPYRSIHIADGIPPLPDWLLRKVIGACPSLFRLGAYDISAKR